MKEFDQKYGEMELEIYQILTFHATDLNHNEYTTY